MVIARLQFGLPPTGGQVQKRPLAELAIPAIPQTRRCHPVGLLHVKCIEYRDIKYRECMGMSTESIIQRCDVHSTVGLMGHTLDQTDNLSGDSFSLAGLFYFLSSFSRVYHHLDLSENQSNGLHLLLSRGKTLYMLASCPCTGYYVHININIFAYQNWVYNILKQISCYSAEKWW